MWVLDNASTGNVEHLSRWKSQKNFESIMKDLTDGNQAIPENCETIFHMAANPDVKSSAENPELHFKQNILATYNLLEAARRSKSLKKFIFTSTSTIYGVAENIPTPEDYGPLKPVSMYGASKLASESLVFSYAYTYGFAAQILRFANVVGARSKHGVIYDFVQKLRANPNQLEILGDGTQSKSYLHVNDCVGAILRVTSDSKEKIGMFNVGTEDEIDVTKIADIICEIMGLTNVKYSYRKVTKEGGGWIGDVKRMRLDNKKLKALGWRPKLNSEQAVRRVVEEIVHNPR